MKGFVLSDTPGFLTINGHSVMFVRHSDLAPPLDLYYLHTQLSIPCRHTKNTSPTREFQFKMVHTGFFQ